MTFKLRSGLHMLKKRIPVYRLFLKIFLWFWATALGIFFLTGIEKNILRLRESVAARNVYATVAPALAAQAVSLYESGGADAFAHFIENSFDDRDRKLYLLDGADRDVLGRRIESDGLETAKASMLGHSLISHGHIAYRMISSTGRPYTLLLYRRSDLGNLRDFLFLHDISSTIAMYLLIGSFSLWLAYHIASPVHSIQSTARKVAGGDLSARVPAFVAKRHDELASLAVDFDAMVDRLEHLIRAQKDLLGSVSHEVRSPLARINLSLAILKSESTGGSDNVMHRLETDVERIDTLMGQLLTLSRLETGLSSAHRQEVDISQTLEEVTADCDFEARSQDKSVSLNAIGNVYLENADAHALRSAFENVIRNAVRFTRPGSRVEVSVREGLNVPEGSVVVTVRDCGPGVPEASLQTIFRPFVQLQNSQLSGEGHNGLGLAIASEAIRMHRGTITARNHPGGGLEVCIQLPVFARVASRAK